MITKTSHNIIGQIGGVYAVTLRQWENEEDVPTLTGPGLWWNHVARDWVAEQPTFADARILLTGGTNWEAGSFWGDNLAFGTFTGRVRRLLHDLNDQNRPIDADFLFLREGIAIGQIDAPVSEILQGQQASLSEVLVVAEERTFRFGNPGDGNIARNVVQLDVGKKTTLAFDWTDIINPGTGIVNGTVTVSSGDPITFSNETVSRGDTRILHVDHEAATSGDRTLICEVTTTDAQPLTGRAFLEVSS